MADRRNLRRWRKSVVARPLSTKIFSYHFSILAQTIGSGVSSIAPCHHEKSTQIRVPFYGGAKGSRTPDLLNAIQTRYQLRYNPELPLYNNITGEELSSVFYGVYGTIFFV